MRWTLGIWLSALMAVAWPVGVLGRVWCGVGRSRSSVDQQGTGGTSSPARRHSLPPGSDVLARAAVPPPAGGGTAPSSCPACARQERWKSTYKGRGEGE